MSWQVRSNPGPRPGIASSQRSAPPQLDPAWLQRFPDRNVIADALANAGTSSRPEQDSNSHGVLKRNHNSAAMDVVSNGWGGHKTSNNNNNINRNDGINYFNLSTNCINPNSTSSHREEKEIEHRKQDTTHNFLNNTIDFGENPFAKGPSRENRDHRKASRGNSPTANTIGRRFAFVRPSSFYVQSSISKIPTGKSDYLNATVGSKQWSAVTSDPSGYQGPAEANTHSLRSPSERSELTSGIQGPVNGATNDDPGSRMAKVQTNPFINPAPGTTANQNYSKAENQNYSKTPAGIINPFALFRPASEVPMINLEPPKQTPTGSGGNTGLEWNIPPVPNGAKSVGASVQQSVAVENSLLHRQHAPKEQRSLDHHVQQKQQHQQQQQQQELQHKEHQQQRNDEVSPHKLKQHGVQEHQQSNHRQLLPEQLKRMPQHGPTGHRQQQSEPQIPDNDNQQHNHVIQLQQQLQQKYQPNQDQGQQFYASSHNTHLRQQQQQQQQHQQVEDKQEQRYISSHGAQFGRIISAPDPSWTPVSFSSRHFQELQEAQEEFDQRQRENSQENEVQMSEIGECNGLTQQMSVDGPNSESHQPMSSDRGVSDMDQQRSAWVVSDFDPLVNVPKIGSLHGDVQRIDPHCQRLSSGDTIGPYVSLDDVRYGYSQTTREAEHQRPKEGDGFAEETLRSQVFQLQHLLEDNERETSMLKEIIADMQERDIQCQKYQGHYILENIDAWRRKVADTEKEYWKLRNELKSCTEKIRELESEIKKQESNRQQKQSKEAELAECHILDLETQLYDLKKQAAETEHRYHEELVSCRAEYEHQILELERKLAESVTTPGPLLRRVIEQKLAEAKIKSDTDLANFRRAIERACNTFCRSNPGAASGSRSTDIDDTLNFVANSQQATPIVVTLDADGRKATPKQQTTSTTIRTTAHKQQIATARLSSTSTTAASRNPAQRPTSKPQITAATTTTISDTQALEAVAWNMGEMGGDKGTNLTLKQTSTYFNKA